MLSARLTQELSDLLADKGSVRLIFDLVNLTLEEDAGEGNFKYLGPVILGARPLVL